ncbi:hypothetical protein [Solitalea canadensis]|uniref:Lipocalin-like domain-containing protein n=1 Tax=Solitalea canadensis (strain ATCC 29591 / DSM 3403 / JCM 21819 / LMG 8368 / NBRC 15130 / NCIMB 12057 / USAM 9D) TaxID=929556 RepID=H8KRV4_SOLCM|nr:hypothetical protein [Solitalea canadensis]AFD07742.1 hypothetical protein Solca_2708 [Solitalea canadensis DSM 3403]
MKRNTNLVRKSAGIVGLLLMIACSSGSDVIPDLTYITDFDRNWNTTKGEGGTFFFLPEKDGVNEGNITVNENWDDADGNSQFYQYNGTYKNTAITFTSDDAVGSDDRRKNTTFTGQINKDKKPITMTLKNSRGGEIEVTQGI